MTATTYCSLFLVLHTPLSPHRNSYNVVVTDRPHVTSSPPPQTMSSTTYEAALAKVFRPDTSINLSQQSDAAVYLSGEIQQYIIDQLGIVSL